MQECELKKINKVFEDELEKQLEILEEQISLKRKMWNQENGKVAALNFVAVLGVLFGLYCIIGGLATGGSSGAFGFVMGLAVFGVTRVIVSEKQRAGINYNINYIDKTIKSLELEKQKEKENYNRKMEELNTKIRQCHTHITENFQKIENCTKYLNCGKDAITQLLFVKNCKAVGIVQKADEDIKKCREIVMNEDIESNIEKNTDMVHIICPACGHGIDEIRSKVIDQGYVICEDCQSMIEVDVSR